MMKEAQWLIYMGINKDLAVRENCNINNQSLCFGSFAGGGTYSGPEGLKPRSEEARKYLAGGNQFRVEELEVFKLEF